MMSADLSIKRRRGGQPGNKNAKGNRGNVKARGRLGNCGGGAPLGNQNARRKRKAPLEVFRNQYRHCAEAIEWIDRNAEHLPANIFADENQRDAALYAGYCGMTPEALAEQGREYEFGLYELIREEEIDRINRIFQD